MAETAAGSGDDAFVSRLRDLIHLHDEIAELFKHYEQVKDRTASDTELFPDQQDAASLRRRDDHGLPAGPDVLGLDAVVANELRYAFRMLLDALSSKHGFTATGQPDPAKALEHLQKSAYQLQIAFHDIIDLTDRFFRLAFQRITSTYTSEQIIRVVGEDQLRQMMVLSRKVEQAIAASRGARERRDDIYFSLAREDAVALIGACVDLLDALVTLRLQSNVKRERLHRFAKGLALFGAGLVAGGIVVVWVSL